MMWGDGMGWGMGWMWIFWLLLILGTVVLVVVLLKAFTGGSGGGARQGGAAPPTGAGPRRSREILEERYARGEISTEEYRERLRTLEEGDR
ncbi:SHOCT domain-containing protein [Kocuria sp. CPCC 205268]|uniref:SHOCT domain-containing protein n=1 Tax=Kocuria oxytropis TaxID=3058913 RepID=UPI0034D4778A